MMPREKPWAVLLGAVLSTRTQDRVTVVALRRLLRRAPNPARLARLQPEEVARLIFPVGFYRVKAEILPALGRALVERFDGLVPTGRKELLSLPGVGPKVAGIVLAQGFGIPAIAVDTHVHRISNWLGLVRTKTPAATERSLRRILPREYWADWNRLLVALGQTVCRPRAPHCAECPINRYCLKNARGRQG